MLHVKYMPLESASKAASGALAHSWVALTFRALRPIMGAAGKGRFSAPWEVRVSSEIRKFVLRLKVIEMLDRYARARRQIHVFRQWKRLLINPN